MGEWDATGMKGSGSLLGGLGLVVVSPVPLRVSQGKDHNPSSP